MSPEALLSLFLAEARTQSVWAWSSADGTGLAATQLVLAAAPAARARVLLLAAEALAVPEEGGARYDTAWSPALGFLVQQLLERDTALSESQLVELVSFSARWPAWDWLDTPPYDAVLDQVDRSLQGGTAQAALSGALRALRARLAVEGAWDAPQQDRFARLDRLLSPAQAAVIPGLDPSDGWAAAVGGSVHALPTEQALAWSALLGHCATARRSTPARRWLARAGELRRAVGSEAFARALHLWLPAVPRALSETNRHVVRGLLWTAGPVADAALADRLMQSAAQFYAGVPGVGAADALLGHAAIRSLADQPVELARPRLRALRERLTDRRALKAIEAALERISRP